MNSKDRLSELQQKDTLTDSEMRELIRLSSPGTFKSLPNVMTIGVIDLKKAIKNFREGQERSKIAFENGCYMEVISLRLQHTEFWLRLYFVAKNKKGKVYSSDNKKTFGVIIEDCKKLGFNENLISKLEEFNKHRINAIHKYLLGGTDYSELEKVCEISQGIDGEVGEYVRRVIGLDIE